MSRTFDAPPGEVRLSSEEQTREEQSSALKVERIQETSGLVFRDQADIERYVEAPLREACRKFLDKNIRTTTSSANIEEGRTEAYVAIDAATPSAANRRVAEEARGKFSSTVHGGDAVTFMMEIGVSTPVDAITRHFNAIADRFETQFPNWIKRMSKEDALAAVGIPLENIDAELGAAILRGYVLGKDGFYYEDARDEERVHQAMSVGIAT